MPSYQIKRIKIKIKVPTIHPTSDLSPPFPKPFFCILNPQSGFNVIGIVLADNKNQPLIGFDWGIGKMTFSQKATHQGLHTTVFGSSHFLILCRRRSGVILISLLGNAGEQIYAECTPILMGSQRENCQGHPPGLNLQPQIEDLQLNSFTPRKIMKNNISGRKQWTGFRVYQRGNIDFHDFCI